MTKVKEQLDGIAQLFLFFFFAVDVALLWITLFGCAPFLCPNFSNGSAPAVFLDQGYEAGPWALRSKCLTLISCMGQQDGNI